MSPSHRGGEGTPLVTLSLCHPVVLRPEAPESAAYHQLAGLWRRFRAVTEARTRRKDTHGRRGQKAFRKPGRTPAYARACTSRSSCTDDTFPSLQPSLSQAAKPSRGTNDRCPRARTKAPRRGSSNLQKQSGARTKPCPASSRSVASQATAIAVAPVSNAARHEPATIRVERGQLSKNFRFR